MKYVNNLKLTSALESGIANKHSFVSFYFAFQSLPLLLILGRAEFKQFELMKKDNSNRMKKAILTPRK